MPESETAESLHDLFVYPKSKGKRTFVLVNSDGTETGAYTGTQPAQAAKKAIKEVAKELNVPVTIRIRARGEKRIHVFRGHVSMDIAPENRPSWMPAVVKTAHVAKVGVEKVDKIGAELVKSGAITEELREKVNALPLPKVN